MTTNIYLMEEKSSFSNSSFNVPMLAQPAEISQEDLVREIRSVQDDIEKSRANLLFVKESSAKVENQKQNYQIELSRIKRIIDLNGEALPKFLARKNHIENWLKETASIQLRKKIPEHEAHLKELKFKLNSLKSTLRQYIERDVKKLNQEVLQQQISKEKISGPTKDGLIKLENKIKEAREILHEAGEAMLTLTFSNDPQMLRNSI